MSHILIFGLGYTAARLARQLGAQGWHIEATGEAGSIRFDDEPAVQAALGRATHMLSSVPPVDGQDPVLARYDEAIRAAPVSWIGYLSSTGVYGDVGGAWVDEASPVGQGRRNARTTADLGWQDLGPPVHVFRLPGIYGPGRSALERVFEGRARRIDLPDQIFSRIHVDDIVSSLIAGMSGPAGVYNLADDRPCPQNEIIDYASALLGLAPPPLQTLEEAQLSPAAAAFYAENRRVANGKAKRLLGWAPRYPDYRAGLAACLAETHVEREGHAAERQHDT